MLTKQFPTVQFQKDTWEINEFDCASMFLLVGSERAMLIDCGTGIGDLRGMVEMITGRPLTVAISRGRVGHTGSGRQFEELWMHPADQKIPIPMSLERRRWDTWIIAHRQRDCIGAPYNMFSLYPYHINEDLRELRGEERFPRIQDLYGGQQFDLGGGRIVTAYECPGHSKGEMVFLGHQTRTLFAGDAPNSSPGVNAIPVETTLHSLRKIQELRGQYDMIYNEHHDFRALGAPLDEGYLLDATAILEDVMAGHVVPCGAPSFWGQSTPLGPGERMAVASPESDKEPKPGKRMTLRRRRVLLHIDPDKAREEGEEDGYWCKYTLVAGGHVHRQGISGSIFEICAETIWGMGSL